MELKGSSPGLSCPSQMHVWKILQAAGRNKCTERGGGKEGPGSQDKEIDEAGQVRAEKPVIQAGAAEEGQTQKTAKTCYKEMTSRSLRSETKPG